MEGGRGFRVRKRGIAHPDPSPAVLLAKRITAHPRAGREFVLARRPNRLPCRIVEQAMVAAAQIVAFDRAPRQWRASVAAAILERDRSAVDLTVHHHRLVQKNPSERRRSDLDRKRRAIPLVPKGLHTVLPCTVWKLSIGPLCLAGEVCS